jgi:hypothetical protein
MLNYSPVGEGQQQESADKECLVVGFHSLNNLMI